VKKADERQIGDAPRASGSPPVRARAYVPASYYPRLEEFQGASGVN